MKPASARRPLAPPRTDPRAPSALAAYVLADRAGAQPQNVALASVVSTQLAQLLDLGRVSGSVTATARPAAVPSGTTARAPTSADAPGVRLAARRLGR